MSRFLPRSLKGLLLLNEGAFVALLLVTGGLGALSAWHWHQSSAEAVRISALMQGAERIRGDMYGQVEEAIRARLTEDPSVLDRFAPYGARIERSFARLGALARGEGERRAVGYLHDAYRVVLADMNKVFTDPHEISEAARMKLLDRAHEEWMLADFESALTVFTGILARRQDDLEADLTRWTRLAGVLIPLPLVLAGAVVVLSVRRLHRHILAPMQALVEDVRALSRGGPEQRVREQGVDEVRGLARSFNELARDLEASRAALVAGERQAALGALVPVVAHNIRNPLASIRATAQLLDADDDEAELLETRRAIIDSADQLERWVRSLLSYLHPLEPRRRRVPFGQVLDGACALIGPRAAQRGVTLRREGPERECSVDPDLLEQALHGLLVNAVEASPEGGVVSLRTEAGAATGGDPPEVRPDALPDGVVLHIDDQGPGIGFDPQPTNLTPGPSTKPWGTGLGIPFAFKVVQAHGGELAFSSAGGGGTRVTVRLPAAGGAGADPGSGA